MIQEAHHRDKSKTLMIAWASVDNPFIIAPRFVRMKKEWG